MRALFELGSFEDVKVDAEGFEGGVRLTFRVTERPLLIALEIEGNKEISTEDLREKAALPLSAPYNPVAAAAAVERMRALYREKGFYQAVIRTTTEPAGEGRVRLKAVVEEGVKYRLVAITLNGVKSLPPDKVLGEMKTEPWTIFSWISGSGKLQQEVLQEDRQRIVSYYQDHGYLEVRVGEPEITVDDTAKVVRVAIADHRGPAVSARHRDAGGRRFADARGDQAVRRSQGGRHLPPLGLRPGRFRHEPALRQPRLRLRQAGLHLEARPGDGARST